jgi:hypothetical protein
MSDLLQEVIAQRLPRLLVAGVDYNDVQLLFRRIRRLQDWRSEWERMAAIHEQLGDAALSAGHQVSAGDAFRRAALYYHVAQFVYFDSAEEKYATQLRQQAAYRKGMAHFRPPAEQIEILFEGITVLRQSAAGGDIRENALCRSHGRRRFHQGRVLHA